MKRKWLWLLAPVALVAFVTLGGEVVMHLWNWLAPPLFGFRLITFWQALGLLILCRVLFGGWGSGKHGGRGRSLEGNDTGRARAVRQADARPLR